MSVCWLVPVPNGTIDGTAGDLLVMEGTPASARVCLSLHLPARGGGARGGVAGGWERS